ncbi:MAG: type I 3-dehydroquinate dehydratase [Treponema sp.]|nr:type I 3-dehydroquinate dehydratase [Treponema sp.]
MAKICICLTAKTLERNLEILEKYRQNVDLAELRVDCLDPDERLLIRRFPEQANVPVILTIRRDVDGGHFVSGEGARINLMARGLAYADLDKRRNFAYIDLEEDINVPSLEEAARTFGTRIIRSYHNIKGDEADLAARVRSMFRNSNEIVKVGVTAKSTWDVLTLLRIGKEFKGRDKILIAMGHYGIFSRILAEQFGSFVSYTSSRTDSSAVHGAPGQFDADELAGLYRYRSITAATKIYGETGYPLASTNSPRFFNATFEMENIDAVYVPFPADSITACIELAKELNIEGLSVTVPYTESVIPFLDEQTPEVQKTGACNTLSRCPQGWMGTNTDNRAFSDSILEFLGRQHLKRVRVTVIGAGGKAKAIAFELHRLGAKALVLNRTAHKARSLAMPYNFAWGSLEGRDIEMMGRYRDVIIQTTPAGTEGSGFGDPVERYSFTGKEKVMDLVHRPETTPFLKRAADAGCQVLNGQDMFLRKAKHQYAQFVGRDFPEHLLPKLRFD